MRVENVVPMGNRWLAVVGSAVLLLFALAPAIASDHSVPKQISDGASVPPGSWGGAHVRMEVSTAGAVLEFDCASGRIDKPLITDADGNFLRQGTVTFEAGGPVRPGQPAARPHAARYVGWTDGTEMRLTVTVLAETERELGTFTLGLGQRAVLEKCL